MEKPALAARLEAYEYHDFINDVQGWLKSGRYVFYMNGNVSPSTAIGLTNQLRMLVNLSPI